MGNSNKEQSIVKLVFHKYWRLLVIIICPLLLLALPLAIEDQKGLSGYLLLLMAVFWLTDALPLAVTSLLPLFLAPMLGLLGMNQVAANYMKGTSISFMGSLFCALAIEKSGLHRRIALRILLALGTQFHWLMLGFMIPTFLLSMFIVNTASAATMLPMVETVLEHIDPDKEHPIDNTYLQDEHGESDNTETPHKGICSEPTLTSYMPRDLSDTMLVEENPAFVDDISINTNFDMEVPKRDVKPNIIQQTLKKSDTLTEDKKEFKKRAKGLTIACAFAANIGGIATLTGTTPNLIMQQHANDLFTSKGFDGPVNYADWMVYGAPTAVVILVLVWLWLWLLYSRKRNPCSNCCPHMKDESSEEDSEHLIRTVILKEYKILGPITYHECAVLLMFSALVMLWFFREPGFMTGWAASFKEEYIQTGVPAMLISVGMFVIPCQLPTRQLLISKKKPDTLLDWPTIQRKFPWVLLFLLGGGYALAEITEESGLSGWIGEKMAVLGELPEPVMVIVVCLIVSIFTEFTSNAAACTLFMPVVAAMAEKLGKSPLYLMFPVAVSTSFSFMLPVATPPNALAFTYGRIRVLDLVKAGSLVNVICIFAVVFANFTWGNAYFKFDILPWEMNNLTLSTTSMVPM